MGQPVQVQVLLSAPTSPTLQQSGFLSPRVTARGLVIPVYASLEQRPAAVVRIDSIATEYRRAQDGSLQLEVNVADGRHPAGHFLLQTDQRAERIGFYTLNFTADGYISTQLQGLYTAGIHLTGLSAPLSKTSVDATYIWAQKAGGLDDEIAWKIALDASGDCILIGRIGAESVSFGKITLAATGKSDTGLAKYDTNGNADWATR